MRDSEHLLNVVNGVLIGSTAVPSPDPEFGEFGYHERGADGSASEACLGSVLAGGAGFRSVEREMKIDVRVEGCVPGLRASCQPLDQASALPVNAYGRCRDGVPRTTHHHTDPASSK